jgi:hypothetical protein
MEVVCINDKNRPNEVPMNRWIKKDQEYTITAVCFMKIQGIYGCKLAEINNDDLFPYQYFALDRFAISVKEIEKAVEEHEIELEELV